MQGFLMKVEYITSSQNPKIKHLVKLKERRAREKSEQFLIEGYREIERALHFKYPLESLFYCTDLFLGENEEALIEKASKYAKIFELPQDLFEKVSYRDRPDGLLVVAPVQKETWEEFEKKMEKRADGAPYFLLLAEAIEKPGNLGSILRSCDAAGVHGVLLCDKKTDVFNPNVVRASIGTLFSVPLMECSSEEALEFLEKHKIVLVATTPHTDTCFTKADLTKSVAIAMGTEQLGLSDFFLKEAKIQVKIPMHGIADSLNVAAATTLVLYEVVRQRS